MALISMQTSPWYDVKNTDSEYLDKTFKMVRDAGIEAIDFNFDFFLNVKIFNDHSLSEVDGFFEKPEDELIEFFRPVKEAAEKNTLAFSQAHAPFPVAVYGEEEKNDYMVMVTEKCLAISKFLGCPALVIHPPKDEDKDIQHELILDFYRKLMPAGKKTGVKICLENLFQRYKATVREGACTDSSDACYYVDLLNKEAGEDIFGFCFDLGHATVTGRNPYRYIKQLGDRLTLLHIHESDGTHDNHQLPFTQIFDEKGELCCDWDGFIQGLKEIGYKGNISFECSRGIKIMPKAVWPEVFSLIAAVGRYICASIEEQSGSAAAPAARR